MPWCPAALPLTLTLLESSSAEWSAAHQAVREVMLAHPADTSRSNLAAALALRGGGPNPNLGPNPATTSLNVACRWMAPSTPVSQSSPSISSNQSHSISSQSPLSLRPNPAEWERLASHSCEAGLSQGHPHIVRYHTTTCQQLPTPQRVIPRHSTPFDGLGSHTSLGVG
jgi:hypothetical protein